MKAKNVIASMLLSILLVCLICGLSACGGKTNEKTENQISKDIQTQDNYFSSCNLKVKSFSITKRQTNPKDKNDFVWCKVTASNSDFLYSAEYKVTYVLYNDGWILEEYNKESSSIEPSYYPTIEQAEALMREYYENHERKYEEITVYNPTQEDTTMTFPCRVSSTNDALHLPYYSDYAVRYQFDPQSGWTSVIDPNVNLWFN